MTHFTRSLTLTLGLGLLTLSPAQAFDIGAMSDAERTAFRAELRAYLLENPEVLIEAFDILDQRQAMATAEAEAEIITTNADALFASPYDYVGGNPEGDVTLVEFLDYRCGYCKRAFPEIEAMLEADGNIRFVVKEFPILGDASLMASRYAIAAKIALGDVAYRALHDAMLQMRGEISETALEATATNLGLDHAAIVAEIDNPQIDATIATNYELARALNISGTPTFVLEGGLLRGALPRAQIEAAIAAERAAN
ncbi:DsbA family protein [Rhodobacteraceae bacterium XHP0102]|nr:DsbA family protein [Rhodobacteraceae bacterium XHP0102]